MNSVCDIAVVGAGLSGIAFARFYLDIHPDAYIIVYDADTHVGGVWSVSRNFDGFWTQSGSRMTGFSDVPFRIPDGSPSFWGTSPARHVSDYLEAYVTSHVYAGKPLRDRVHLQTRVVDIKKKVKQSTQGTSCWEILSRTLLGESHTIQASKLVIATGRTSTPLMPEIAGQDKFPGKIISHMGFGRFLQEDREYEQAAGRYKNVVILGSGKSAADLAYDAAKRGKQVTWITKRTKTTGPCLFFPAPGKGRYLNSVEQGSTRYSQLFSPSSFAPAGHPLMNQLHRSKQGQDLTAGKRDKARNGCIALPKYRTREGALPGFRDLEPDSYPFWFTGPLGLAQHNDFWDTIATKIQVYRREVDRLTTDGTVVLEDRQEVRADIILCGTGWKVEYPFFADRLIQDFGMPHSPEDDTPEDAELWSSLLHKADEKVISLYPLLASPPKVSAEPGAASTMARLYNGMVPLAGSSGLAGDRSLVFLGHCEMSNSFRSAEAQAIWATAYLDGSLAASGSLPSLQEAQNRVAYMNAFSKRRYPTRGQKGDCLFFELIWYTDALMAELGLSSHRRGKSWLDDWLEPCLASDFKDMVHEYKEKFANSNA